jgi:hypothetical protein
VSARAQLCQRAVTDVPVTKRHCRSLMCVGPCGFVLSS